MFYDLSTSQIHSSSKYLFQGFLKHLGKSVSSDSGKISHTASFSEAVLLFSESGDPNRPLSPRSAICPPTRFLPSLSYVSAQPCVVQLPEFLHPTVGSCLQVTPEGFCLASVLSDSLTWCTVSVFDLCPLDILPRIWLYNNNICVHCPTI